MSRGRQQWRTYTLGLVVMISPSGRELSKAANLLRNAKIKTLGIRVWACHAAGAPVRVEVTATGNAAASVPYDVAALVTKCRERTPFRSRWRNRKASQAALRRATARINRRTRSWGNLDTQCDSRAWGDLNAL